MNLIEWANDWNIPLAAIEDFKKRAGMINTLPAALPTGQSEASVQARTRLDASRKGKRLWRNNCGAYQDERGNFIRYGLCNDSAQMSREIKSFDLIGIDPVFIRQHHVGTIIGQFMARECKPEGWHFTGTDHENGQLKFINLVNSLGGNAGFTTTGQV